MSYREHIDWCQTTYRLLRDGGVWGVPRSSLVFKKEAQHTRLKLIEPKALSPSQEDDFQVIRDHFQAAGINVQR